MRLATLALLMLMPLVALADGFAPTPFGAERFGAVSISGDGSIGAAGQAATAGAAAGESPASRPTARLGD